jgi:hypothetical protein
MITFLRDMAAKMSGMVRAPECRRLDLEAELRPGRLILLDSGMHQPIRHYASFMPNLGTLAHRRTVEIRSWGFLTSWKAHRARQDRRHRERGYKPYYPEVSGDYGLVERKVFERDGERVSQFEMYSTENRPVEKLNSTFAAELQSSIETNLKTLVSLEHCMNRDEGDMESALVESINIGIAAVEQAKDEGLELLKDAGAPILVVYTVSSPCPMTDLPSDLHMIERYQLKSQFEDEVMLSTEERVVIVGMNEHWKIERPRWVHPDANITPLQSVAQYNEIQRNAA